MKENKRQTEQRRKASREMWIAAGLLAILILAVVAVVLLQGRPGTQNAPETKATVPPQSTEALPEGFSAVSGADASAVNEALTVRYVGRYTGQYMEDGSDDPIVDVLALIVENTGDEIVEYAEIDLDCGTNTATFCLSALPAGGKALVLAEDRRIYTQDMTIAAPVCTQFATVRNVVLDFGGEFQLSTATGVINIENLTEQDYKNSVAVYYKNYQDGFYMGGIAYRASAQDGIGAGQIVQLLQSHYSKTNSVILYMTYDE